MSPSLFDRRRTLLRSHLALALGLTLLPLGARSASAQADYEAILRFETNTAARLGGWSGGPPETLSLDSVVVQGGRYAGRIERGAATQGEFSAFTFSLPRTFAGRTLELRGWLRTEDVTGFAGLWLRQDGPNGQMYLLDNMERRGLRGTTGWTEYRIALPLDTRTRTIVLGALLVGEGTLWVDELELLVDGGPAARAPTYDGGTTSVRLAPEFATGSQVETQSLVPHQIDNLVLLGKVWGFAKYHDPRLNDDERDADSELFRVLPTVLEAPDRAGATRLLASWLAGLGELPECSPCATLSSDLHLSPEIDWIHDTAALGEDLSHTLIHIHLNRALDGTQRYVSLLPRVGNPDFSNEAFHEHLRALDAGYRLLALYRYWNVIQYWFPYRDVIGEDWDGVLRGFIPRLVEAEGRDEYRLTMIKLIARIHDTHANLWHNLDLQPPRGTAQLPVTLRFIDANAVVTGFSHPEFGPASGLQVGDVITHLDGAPVDSMIEAWQHLYSASNQPTRLRDMARTLSRGLPGPVRVAGIRSTGPFEVTAERAPMAQLDLGAGRTHDLPGETFQILDQDVAYLKLSSVLAADVPDYVRAAMGTRVLVVDIRNYPSEFVVFTLGRHLVAQPTEFARFTQGDLSNPGAFRWTDPVVLEPAAPRYTGKVVILVDETTQSQAEYTAMALRAAPNAIVVGSTTAGADGNVSRIPLPGGIESMISGIGVFYPDGTPTQRIGIVPDLEVYPTVAGIRAGRDEVLEAAVSHALGREFRLAGQ